MGLKLLIIFSLEFF